MLTICQDENFQRLEGWIWRKSGEFLKMRMVFALLGKVCSIFQMHILKLEDNMREFFSDALFYVVGEEEEEDFPCTD